MADKAKSWSVAAALRACDFYRMMPRDLTQPTVTGATMSVISLLVMAILLFSQLFKLMEIKAVSELVLTEPGSHSFASANKINITVELHFFACPCELLELEYQDSMGSRVANVFREPGNRLRKDVIDAMQQVTGHWVDDDTDPIKVEQVIQSMNARVGCRVIGQLEVYKAPGQFRIFPNENLSNQLFIAGYPAADLSHRITALHFGLDEVEQQTFNLQTGQLSRPADSYSPLAGTVAQQPMIYSNIQFGFYSAYFADVTPLTTVGLEGERWHSLQYSATHQNMLIQGQSQFILKYELSPVTVVYTHQQMAFLDFLIHLCAVIGGFMSVTSIIASLISQAQAYIKQEEGAQKPEDQ